MSETYKIVRHFERGPKRVIKTGLTLEEAQAHCQDPETSYKTCTTRAGRERTRRCGIWFDSYTAETPKTRRVSRRRNELAAKRARSCLF